MSGGTHWITLEKNWHIESLERFYPDWVPSVIARFIKYPIRRFVEDHIPTWDHTLRVKFKHQVMGKHGSMQDLRVLKVWRRILEHDDGTFLPDFEMVINSRIIYDIAGLRRELGDDFLPLADTVLHEMQHVAQMLDGRIPPKDYGESLQQPMTPMEYWCHPCEVDARTVADRLVKEYYTPEALRGAAARRT